MTTIAYNLIYLAIIIFAVAYVITSLSLIILVILRKVDFKLALYVILFGGFVGGLVVGVGWNFLNGPDSILVTKPFGWIEEILNTPLNPWQPK